MTECTASVPNYGSSIEHSVQCLLLMYFDHFAKTKFCSACDLLWKLSYGIAREERLRCTIVDTSYYLRIILWSYCVFLVRAHFTTRNSRACIFECKQLQGYRLACGRVFNPVGCLSDVCRWCWHGRRGASGPPAETEDDEEKVLRAARGDTWLFGETGVLWVGEEVQGWCFAASRAHFKKLL